MFVQGGERTGVFKLEWDAHIKCTVYDSIGRGLVSVLLLKIGNHSHRTSFNFVKHCLEPSSGFFLHEKEPLKIIKTFLKKNK